MNKGNNNYKITIQKRTHMKNIILISLTLICLACTTNLSAQYYPDIEFKKGDLELDLGFGLMNTFIDKNTKAAMPPLSMRFSYRVKKTISIGTYVGYSRTNYVAPQDLTDNPKIPEMTNNHFQVGVRGQGHFVQDRFDFYGGAMLGYNFSINSFDNLGADDRLEGIVAEKFSDKVIFSGFIGGKYLLTEHVGLFGEVGYGVSIFNLGVTTRF